jgi:glutamate carboxypeptidase
MRGELFAYGLALALVLVAAPAPAQRLEADELELRVSLQELQPEMEKLLADWVALNTGTFNTAGLEAFAPLLATRLQELGFAVTIESGTALDWPDRKDFRTGPLIVAERKAEIAPERARHFLLSGHFDTVFEPDSPFQTLAPDPNDPTRARGPGALDMKGGLVVLLYALRALSESGDLARADYTVLLNSDEELGSLGSRPRIEAEAKRAQVGLVFEAARENGEMARSRSGVGQFHLAVDGVAAHAAASERNGKSAILALAKKVIAIEALTDFTRGLILNVGTIYGGTKRNIVPAHAGAWIDLRYEDAAQGEAAKRELEKIAAADDFPGTKATLWGMLHRPPKPATRETDDLLAAHRAIARELGLPTPDAAHSAGVTDGSLMAAAGLPTLDSMGVRGGGAHTDQEFVVLRSLSERATLAALLLRRLGRAPGPGLPPEAPKLESTRPSPPVIAGSRPVVGP